MGNKTDYFWIKWKPEKFLMAVRYFSVEEVGQYCLMLNEQAVDKSGRIPVELFNDVAKSDKVRGKFAEDDAGFYNEVMEATLIEREKLSKARSDASKGEQTGNKPVTKGEQNDSFDDTKGVTHVSNYNSNVSLSNKKGNCLLKNSGVELKDVRNNFALTQDLHLADPGYYFNTALDWSDSKGEMRKDWLATIRNFARRDMKDGKMKVSNNQQMGGSNLSKEKFTPSPTTGREVTREQYLENKKRKEAGHA